MNCSNLLKTLNDYLDDDVAGAVCRELEAHLKGCNACRVVLDTTRKTLRLYRDEKVHSLPRGLRRRLHRVLKDNWTA